MDGNLYGKSVGDLQETLRPLTSRAFHARQLARWMYGRGECDFSRMTDLPLSVREGLASRYCVRRPRIELRQSSSDGTVKYLLDLEDGQQVESVFIPETDRATFCISSQIGCPLDCSFCLTATMGLVRNLSAGEILGQVAIMAEENGLSPNHYNLVFMGMGEPLNNYDRVMSAFRLLTDPDGLGIAPRHITLSTAGVVPGLLRLAQEKVRPRLAVSLSATTDELRDRLMPINRAYPLATLFSTLRQIPLAPRERVTLEYVMLDGINDRNEDVTRLTTLTARLPVKVNLIPYNQTHVPDYHSPAETRTREFRDRLLARGIPASIRKRRGADISAACGQLALSSREKSRSSPP